MELKTLFNSLNDFAKKEPEFEGRGDVFLLRGPWGVGKTCAVEERIKSDIPINLFGKNIIRIPIFGINNLHDFIYYFYSNQNFKSKLKNRLKKNKELKLSVNVLGSGAEIPLLGILNAFIPENKPNKKEKYLLIFDDLERSDRKIEIKDIFGFVDSLPSNFKTILICNEEKISFKDFKNLKEKVVNVDFYFDSFDNDLLNKLLKSQNFLDLFNNEEKFKTNNLRIIKRIDQLFQRLEKMQITNKAIYKAVYYCTLFVLEDKASEEYLLELLNKKTDKLNKMNLGFNSSYENNEEIVAGTENIASNIITEIVKSEYLLSEIKKENLNFFIESINNSINTQNFINISDLTKFIENKPFKNSEVVLKNIFYTTNKTNVLMETFGKLKSEIKDREYDLSSVLTNVLYLWTYYRNDIVDFGLIKENEKFRDEIMKMLFDRLVNEPLYFDACIKDIKTTKETDEILRKLLLDLSKKYNELFNALFGKFDVYSGYEQFKNIFNSLSIMNHYLKAYDITAKEIILLNLDFSETIVTLKNVCTVNLNDNIREKLLDIFQKLRELSLLEKMKIDLNLFIKQLDNLSCSSPILGERLSRLLNILTS